MDKRKSQNKQSFYTNLNTKEFEEVSVKTIKELKLRYKNRRGLRSIIFSKSLNLYLFKVDLIKFKLRYRGSNIEIFKTSFNTLLSKKNSIKISRKVYKTISKNGNRLFKFFDKR